MNSSLEEVVVKRVVGRITRAPELSHSSAGVPICRFIVASDRGPAKNPVVTRVCVQGVLGAPRGEDLAIRCTRLLEGDVVQVMGEEEERTRCRGGIEYPEKYTIARDVRLKGRLGHE
jgi:hypothetical protein